MNRPAYLYEDDDFDRVVKEERRKRLTIERLNMPRRGRMAFSSASSPSKSAASKPSASIELLSSAAITPTPIHWLWPGWLAEGRLQILAGAPGAGKTTMALKFAAMVSAAATLARWNRRASR